MIVISGALVLSPPGPGEELGNPAIGWHNLVTVSNVTADTTEPGFPASNLANPSTPRRQSWIAGDTTAQSLVVDLSSFVGDVDYIGVAGHNLGSTGANLVAAGSTDDGENYFPLTSNTVLPDDAPTIFRFPAQSLTNIALSMAFNSEPARIAVLYVGKLLVLQHGILVGYTPLPYGRVSRMTAGVSENGQFLGNVESGAWQESVADLGVIDPEFYRDKMDPFIAAYPTTPFFFAWAPVKYPRETGYAWLPRNESRPQPRINHAIGLIDISLPMQGLVGR